MTTNNSAPNIFGDLAPSLVPDLSAISSNNYSLEQPRDRSSDRSSRGGGAVPLIFGGANDVIDFRVASNNAGGRRPVNVFAGEGNNFVLGGRGNDRIFAGAGNDIIEAGNGNNNIIAGDGTNLITSGSGNDTVVGGAGNDFIDAGNGRNTIVAGAGDNRILTGSGRDNIFGGAGNDVVFSGAGNDTIDTGSGNNLISAGVGNDNVTLGAGRDRIILDGGEGSVTVNGFNAAVDRLRLGESLLGRSLSFSSSNGNTLVRSGRDLLATLVGVATGSQALVDRGPLTRYAATDLGSLAQDPSVAVAVAAVNAVSVNDFGVVAGRYNTGEVFANTSLAGVANPNNPVRQTFVFENGVSTALTSTGVKVGESSLGAPNGSTITLRSPNVNNIGNRGDIIGTADEVREPTPLPTDRALRYTNDGTGYTLTINDFGDVTPGSTPANGIESYFLDINNSNQISGRNIVFRPDASGAPRAFEIPLFIDADGAITSLADLGGDGGTAQGINGQGTVVGFLDTDGILDGDETFNAVVWRQDASGQYVLENLGTFGDQQSRAIDINNAGSIIGASSNAAVAATATAAAIAATSSPFILRNGEYTSIGSLGGRTGSANEINEFGTVVGASQIAAGTNRAYVWSLGVQTDLNSLVTSALTVSGAAVTLTNAVSVNNFGEIVATGTYTYRNAAGVDTVGTRSYLLREVA
jgi:probable HAF family extracellular repeat protein